MYEIVDTIMGKAMPGKNPKTPHAVLQGSQGKQANLYLKGHRLAIMRGRQSSPVVHAIIVSKGGRDSDLIKVADEATLRAQEHEAMLSKLAPGSKVFVNGPRARSHAVQAGARLQGLCQCPYLYGHWLGHDPGQTPKQGYATGGLPSRK
jgi:hypothetical protein